ncbi:glycosyltransferase family 4 protein [Natrinema sp. HArc-T2]|uniref:glycosyltransferase family 4 protein n=1 Tax=Natrinema sp. HArc-T2 TaxID=3242701 RepID=UPI00359CC7E3
MKEVCVISTAHYTFDPRIFYRESAALVEAGYDVTFVTHHDRDTVQEGIQIRSLGTAESRTDRWRDILSAYRTARDVDADVYHFHDPELIPVGRRLARTTDARVIYDVHEDYDTVIRRRDWIPDPVSLPLSKLFPAVQSAASSPFDAIIAATDWIEDDFVERGHEPVQLVRNFPRIEDIDLNGEAKTPEADLTLVYVGSFGGNHGLLRMIDLVEALRDRDVDAELWVIGEFSKPSFEATVRRRIETSPHGEWIKLFGYINYTDMFAYLNRADMGLALVDSELYEYCVPNKVFEYMAAKLPVMVPDVEGMRRYLDDACGFRVDVDDTTGQAGILERAAGDEIDLEEMGERGRERVEEAYSWEKEKEHLLSLYEQL